jgi:predicted  nucleic acid-binding Zn-ribbon protein
LIEEEPMDYAKRMKDLEQQFKDLNIDLQNLELEKERIKRVIAETQGRFLMLQELAKEEEAKLKEAGNGNKPR